jgi:hypothetical protein
MAGLESFGYLIVMRRRDKARKLLIAPELDLEAWAVGMS